MDTNDKVKMTVVSSNDETNEVKIQLNVTYGIASLDKGEK